MIDQRLLLAHHWVETRAVVAAGDGLHARPAIRLARLARRFVSVVQLRLDSDPDWLDGKSVAKLMSLRADHGQTICLRAQGPDAPKALVAIQALIVSGFAERDPDPE